MNNKRYIKYIIYFLMFILLFLLLKFFENGQMQSTDCTTPYLSGAANWSIFDGWRVNIDEMKAFRELNIEEKLSYRFNQVEETVSYSYNAIGLMYINVLSRLIFFWQGDLQSIISIQQIIHILFSFWILFLLKPLWKKIIFYFAYVINPLILYFVDFPYYYFWQVVPSAILLIYILRKKAINNKIFILAILFALIVIVRPSTLFIVLFVLVYISYMEKNFLKGSLAIVMFIFLTFILKPNSVNEPWHTMYTGIGGYSNEYNITFKDTGAYKKFEDAGGEIIRGCSTNMDNNDFYIKYNAFIKKEYLNILKESPFLLVRNMCLNILQSYGFGYVPNFMIVNYFSSFVGLIFIVLLLYYKEYWIFFFIGISTISFTPYYPPIAAYMFGSYILILYGWLNILYKIRRN